MKIEQITNHLCAIIAVILVSCHSPENRGNSVSSAANDVTTNVSYLDALTSAIKSFPIQFNISEYSVSPHKIEHESLKNADRDELAFYKNNWLFKFQKTEDVGVIGARFVLIYVNKISGKVSEILIR